MSQSNSKPNPQEDTLPQLIFMLLGGVVLLTFLPVMVFSMIFAYLSYASFYEKEERKWIRSGIILASGFFITFAGWGYLREIIPTLIEGGSVAKKVTGILATPLVAKGAFAYFLLVPGGWYLLNMKGPSFALYNGVRNLTLFLFWPFKILKITVAALVAGITGAIFNIKLEPHGLAIRGFVLLSGLLLSEFLFRYANNLAPTPSLKLVAIAVAGSYLAVYWYHFLFHLGEKDPAAVNLVESMRGNDIEIGRLTHPKRMPLRLSWRDINHHIHILGQPGVGKSVLLKNIYAHQIMQGEGLLMLDLKADYKVREDFKSLCKMASREQDFVLIDLSHPESSYGYNPLLLGNATELKDKIIGAIEWSEPYYKKVSERTLLTVLRGLVYLRDQKGMVSNLEDLLVAISTVQGVTLLAEQVDEASIRADIQNLAAGFSKDFAKDLESLKTELTLLVKAEFGGIFSCENTLDVFSAIMEKKVILVNLDGQTYNESAKKFGRLLLADLRSASGAIVTNIPEQERPRFAVLVDEFSDIVSTEDMAKTFVGFLNRCRGSGIGVVIAHQSLGDFKDPTVKSQIMDSTETMFSFVQKDPETCDILASVVGTKESYEKTKQTKEWIFGDDNTGMGTKKLVHEFIYHPNVFRNLNVGEAIYAAKKPSRFGTVQVKMLEIPHVPQEQTKVKAPCISDMKTLALNDELNKRRTEYTSAIRNSTTKIEDLEI